MSDFIEDAAQIIASHQMTRNSTTDDPSGYRVWVSCRCKWISDDIEDPNTPNVELVKARHIAEAVESCLLGNSTKSKKTKRTPCCNRGDRGLWYHEQTCKNWGQTY